MKVGDFNGDGISDVLLQNASDTYTSTYLLLGDGAGGFKTRQEITNSYAMDTTIWSAERRVLHVGDIDGNGHLDIVLQNASDTYLDSYALIGAQVFKDLVERITPGVGEVVTVGYKPLRKAASTRRARVRPIP